MLLFCDRALSISANYITVKPYKEIFKTYFTRQMPKRTLSTQFYTVITIPVSLSGSVLAQRTERLETTEMRFIRAIEDYRLEVNKINEDITE